MLSKTKRYASFDAKFTVDPRACLEVAVALPACIYKQEHAVVDILTPAALLTSALGTP